MKEEFKPVWETIRETRLKKNFSQDYLAKKLGISQKAYSKIENNETRLNVETLMNISAILEVPIGHFFADGKAPILNDFSNRTGGDNVIYKTEKDATKEELYIELLKAKDEIITSKNNEILAYKLIIEHNKIKQY